MCCNRCITSVLCAVNTSGKNKKTPVKTGVFTNYFFMVLAHCSEGGKNKKYVCYIHCAVLIYIICAI